MPQTGERGQSTLSLFMRNDSSESHRGEGGALQHPPEGTSQAAPFTAASLTAVHPRKQDGSHRCPFPFTGFYGPPPRPSRAFTPAQLGSSGPPVGSLPPPTPPEVNSSPRPASASWVGEVRAAAALGSARRAAGEGSPQASGRWGRRGWRAPLSPRSHRPPRGGRAAVGGGGAGESA